MRTGWTLAHFVRGSSSAYHQIGFAEPHIGKQDDPALFFREIKLPEQERAGRGLIDEEKVIIAY